MKCCFHFDLNYKKNYLNKKRAFFFDMQSFHKYVSEIIKMIESDFLFKLFKF